MNEETLTDEQLLFARAACLNEAKPQFPPNRTELLGHPLESYPFTVLYGSSSKDYYYSSRASKTTTMPATRPFLFQRSITSANRTSKRDTFSLFLPFSCGNEFDKPTQQWNFIPTPPQQQPQPQPQPQQAQQRDAEMPPASPVSTSMPTRADVFASVFRPNELQQQQQQQQTHGYWSKAYHFLKDAFGF